jgi:hypothetical protein
MQLNMDDSARWGDSRKNSRSKIDPRASADLEVPRQVTQIMPSSEAWVWRSCPLATKVLSVVGISRWVALVSSPTGHGRTSIEGPNPVFVHPAFNFPQSSVRYPSLPLVVVRRGSAGVGAGRRVEAPSGRSPLGVTEPPRTFPPTVCWVVRANVLGFNTCSVGPWRTSEQ